MFLDNTQHPLFKQEKYRFFEHKEHKGFFVLKPKYEHSLNEGLSFSPFLVEVEKYITQSVLRVCVLKFLAITTPSLIKSHLSFQNKIMYFQNRANHV